MKPVISALPLRLFEVVIFRVAMSINNALVSMYSPCLQMQMNEFEHIVEVTLMGIDKMGFRTAAPDLMGNH